MILKWSTAEYQEFLIVRLGGGGGGGSYHNELLENIRSTYAVNRASRSVDRDQLDGAGVTERVDDF